jgi:recombination associated protein RdgC
MFRNVVTFTFEPFVLPPIDDVRAGLAELPLADPGPLELCRDGFLPPVQTDSEDPADLLVEVGGAWLLSIGTNKRALPGPAVDKALNAKLRAIEQQDGRRPGGRTRKRIKDEIIMEMLPKAPIVPGRTWAVIDTTTSRLHVDTSSVATAEAVASLIRRALGSFPALHLNAEVSPRSVLTGWVAGEPLPDGLSLGDALELRDPADKGAKVTMSGVEIYGDEVVRHLEHGRQATRVQVVLDDHVSVVLGEDLVLRKLQLLDGALDSLEQTEREDLAAEYGARLALFSGELRRLMGVLDAAFKVTKMTATH